MTRRVSARLHAVRSNSDASREQAECPDAALQSVANASHFVARTGKDFTLSVSDVRQSVARVRRSGGRMGHLSTELARPRLAGIESIATAYRGLGRRAISDWRFGS
jgi:hypothetical protein